MLEGAGGLVEVEDAGGLVVVEVEDAGGLVGVTREDGEDATALPPLEACATVGWVAWADGIELPDPVSLVDDVVVDSSTVVDVDVELVDDADPFS